MKNFDIQERMNKNLIEGLKGLVYGGFYLFMSIIKFYFAILLYLILWPVFLMNWMINGNKKEAIN